MKKKGKIICLFLMILFCTSGCDMIHASTTRDIRHSGFSVLSSEMECPDLWTSDDEYENLKFFSTTFAVDEEGTFYTLSLSKKYQNGSHCKVPDAMANKKVVAIYDSKIAKTSDGKMYYITSGSDKGIYSEVTSEDSNYSIYKLLADDSSIIKAVTVDSSNGYYYALKTDGNVYKMIFTKNGNNYSLSGSPLVYSKSNYGGKIVDFGYAGESSSTYIRTETQIFRMLAQNSEECFKYADVICKYSMELDSGLSEHLDEIFAYNGNYLITTYGKQFSATS